MHHIAPCYCSACWERLDKHFTLPLQAEVCAGTVADVLRSVVNGADGCVFCFGHAGLGKTYTMMGDDGSSHSLGVAPCAISWLYRLVEEHRERTGARVILRASAVEISGREETLRDLLGGASSDGPVIYLREDPICGSELCNQSEVDAPSPEQAASLLDEALAGRSSSRDSEEDERRHSHMLFTLHLYQQHLDQGQAILSVGRSRLHLIDLGSCEPITSKDQNGADGGQTLTLPTLGNVILALTSGAKHVPYRDNKLTMLLRESLGNINCRTTMIAHISDSEANYVETLTAVQLASRVHRMRKKKSKYGSSSSGGDTPWDEGPQPADLRFCHPQTLNLTPPALHCTDRYGSSKSTRACDAVIYVGLGGAAVCECELGVSEAPPTSVPIIPSLNRKRVRDGRPGDGDHFECNTFAELQDWLECVGGSEGGRGTGGEAAKPTMRVFLSNHIATPSTEPRDPPKCPPHSMPATHSASSACSVSETDRYKWPDLTLDSFGRTGDDREKSLFSEWRSGAFNQSGSLNRRHLPKPTVNSFHEVASQRAPSVPEGSSAYRAPPVGMSQQEEPWRGPGPGAHTPSWAPAETRPLRPTPRRVPFDQDVLTTTVTLRRPVELNGEDELVFTLVEELSVGGLADNGVPSDITSFHSNSPSPQALPAVSRRVAIVSSINDEFDAYTSQAGPTGLGIERGHSQDTGPEGAILSDFPGMLREASSFKRDTTSSIIDGTSPVSDKFPTRKFPPTPESTKATSRVYKNIKVSALNTFPHPQVPQACSTLPRNMKPTSSVTRSSSSHEQQRPKGKPDDPWLRIDSRWDSRAAELSPGGRLPRNGTRRSGGNSNSVPRQPKPQSHRSPQRLVDGCERSHIDRADAPRRTPVLRRGATTLGTVPVIHESAHGKQNQDGMLATGSLKILYSGKKMSGPNGASPKPRGHSPSTPPVQRYNLDPKARNNLAASALKSSEAGVSMLEMEFDMRFKGYSSSYKTSSLKADYSSAKTKPSLKARRSKGSAGHCYGSLERCDSLLSVGSKPGLSRDSSDASLGSRGRSGRSGSKPGSPVSTSPPPCTSPRTYGKLGQIQGSMSTAAVVNNGNQARAMFSASHSSTVCAVAPVARNVILPPSSKAAPHSAIMGMKQVTRAANSRVSELASGGPSRHPRGLGEVEVSGKLDDGEPLPPLPPSPYSKVTAPRKAAHRSSGHCSDNSSVLSGELPPAMGRTALFYHSGGSSGYESMIRDSEATGSNSSARESFSESNVSSLSRYRAPRKRTNGYQRRRLIPAPLPDTSPVGKKASTMGQWVDLLPVPGALKEPFEIKVYEIDDATHLQQQRPGGTTEPFQDVEKGLLYFNARLKMLERRQQQIRDLRAKHEKLKGELEDVKNRLMLDPRKWIGEFEVDPDLDKESQEYLEALAQATGELEYLVNLCKSRVMMETCFDIEVASRAQGGLHEMQV
ncbi:hypothetical protein AAFF_G00240780 [Aldrovandia affinis]|uniref:Kinesin motor domain-containing protein n=1 Tax=Aldrovandia affinis TaxID=143900 RepID=A0AAD7SVR0_9TELE|nr:hypothetical protein AAFF_G00240780 [Aldrovandia affinis]